MSRGIRAIFLGMFIVLLAWIVWRATGSYWGWLALFVPGGIYVLFGCVWTVEDE